MECRKDAGSTVNPSAIGLPDQAFSSEVRIFDLLRMQECKDESEIYNYQRIQLS